MKLKRKPRAVTIQNPCTLETLSMPWFDDLLTGYVRSHRAESKNKTEIVDVEKVKQLFDSLQEFSSKLIEEELHVSSAQARYYMQVIKQAVPSILNKQKDYNDYYHDLLHKANENREQFNDIRHGFYSGLNKFERKIKAEDKSRSIKRLP